MIIKRGRIERRGDNSDNKERKNREEGRWLEYGIHHPEREREREDRRIE